MDANVQVSYGLLSVLFVVFLEGAVAYTVDRRAGTRLYRWWYDLTHKDPLPEGADRGFIYERRANARFSTATVIAIAQSALAFWSGATSPVWAVIYTVLQIPVLLAGFYAGPFANRLWERKQPLLDVVDELESGKTTVGEIVHDTADALRSKLHVPGAGRAAATVTPLLRAVGGGGEEATSPKPPADDPAPEPDGKAAFDRFTRGGK